MWQILFAFSPHSQQECLTAALRCFKAELQTVQFECKDPEEVITQAQDFLQDHISARESGVSVCNGKAMKSSESCSQANSPVFRSFPAGIKLHRVLLWELVWDAFPRLPGRHGIFTTAHLFAGSRKSAEEHVKGVGAHVRQQTAHLHHLYTPDKLLIKGDGSECICEHCWKLFNNKVMIPCRRRECYLFNTYDTFVEIGS